MSVVKLDEEKPRRRAASAKRKTARGPKQVDEGSFRRRTPDFDLERSDLRAHYENVAAQTLSSIKRDWRSIASLVALALALACAVIPLMPRHYSATALVYPNLFSGDQGKLVPMGTIDAASLVTGEARLIVSDAILQAVVERLGLDRKPGTSGSISWASAVMDWFRAMVLPETRTHSPLERQVALLRNRVEVVKDTRSYLISLSFTARSPEQAAAVVNGIALEYFREKKVRRAQSGVAAAEDELLRLLATDGERHPKVLQAADRLESARAELRAVMATDGSSRDALVADEGVKLAIPNRTPTGPKGVVILGLSFVVSLLAGVGLAVWRDRLGVEPRRFVIGLVSPGLRRGLHHFEAFLGGGAAFGKALFHRFAVGSVSAVRRVGEMVGAGGMWIANRWRRLRASVAEPAQRALDVLRMAARWIAERKRRQESCPVASASEG